MVGLADIPIVGKFVEKVSEYTVDAVFRGLHYMFCYQTLVNDLNSEIEKLNIEEEKMSRKVMEEKANGKIIEDYVVKWQTDVEEIQKSAQELSSSCNPLSRFRLGRNAAKKSRAVAELSCCGKDYLSTGEIAHLASVQNIPNSDTKFEEFQSRKDAYQKLWDALVNEDSPLIHGIYGMAGVGKTRMMEQFWEDAMKKKIFNSVVRVNVGSENMDKIKFQDKVAGRLNCRLVSEDVERRSSQLEHSLMNRGKVLLVLDDVWREIYLGHIIGTSFGDSSSSKGSKILLTSRERDVCLLNNCENLVEIKTLSTDEALYLFKNAVGPDTINSLQNESLVRNVCDECGHLPLLIHAVGKALKGKPHIWWEDAHNQLKKGKFEEIGVDPRVYKGIKLSIENIKYEDARWCLFLCSLFPEDANIDMKMLIQLATGSQLIPDGESRVLAMVDHLKRSSLLLDSGKEDETKVHDIIRDVARSIAFTESKYAFLQVTCNSRDLPSNANYCNRRLLRLDAEADYVEFDEHLICPDLRTLWLQSNYHPQQFSGSFFSMFANISCLMLQKVIIYLEDFSLQPLCNLGTLSLLECDMSNTGVSLFPKKLKTLCICQCWLPESLDVANLKCLRKLEIQARRAVLVMENVISSLSSLEELHISNGFAHDDITYYLEPIVMEISKLTRLTSLHFEFYQDYSINPFQGTNIFSNINRYNIFVGTERHKSFIAQRDWKVPLTRSIEFCGIDSKPWEGLMARAEEVELRDSAVQVSCICNDHQRAFQDLKRLCIYKCNSMEHIASISLDEIEYNVQSATCFSKLTNLEVVGCSKLGYLFCSNIAKGLVQLQELSIGYCKSMEAIILNEGMGEIINWSKLKSLKIVHMRRLTSFFVRNSVHPLFQYKPLFDEMVAFPCLEYIFIRECHNLSSIFSPSLASDLKQLKQMNIRECKEMIGITGVDEQATSDGVLFPELMFLELVNLPCLTSFWCYGKANTCKVPLRFFQLSSIVLIDLPDLRRFFDDENFEFDMPALKMVIIDRCRLSTLFTFSMLRKFQLKRLGVKNCEFLVNIVEDSRDEEICDLPIMLSELTKVDLANLPKMEVFFHNTNFEFHMPALKKVNVTSCILSTLFTLSKFRILQLENLEVSDCELLENIVEDLRGDVICDRIVTLSQLATITLEKLPMLKSFFHNANYEFHMPVMKKVKVLECGLSNALFTRSLFQNLKQLEELSVCDCELLEGIFEDAKAGDTLDLSDKIITLNRVSTVHLEGLPKFKNIFYGATYECYMPALKDVKIVGCGLSVLFTCSVFRGFQQLENLHVSNCQSLEHIVEEVGGDEISEMNSKSIKSSKLSSITLEFLPNLKSFSCALSYVFYMPKLQNFKLIDCPGIDFSSSSKINTSLVRVTSDWCSKEEFQDLDDFIRQNQIRGSYSSDMVGESSYSECETNISV
ncbi:hypothetical protein ACET3Z_009008 [Daucus carota]